MEPLYLILDSIYAALHVLMMCCFIETNERSLLKMKPMLWTIPENSVSVLLRLSGIVCGFGLQGHVDRR